MATSKLFLILTTLPCLLAAQTSVNLTASPTPSVFGAPVVLTATVSSAAANPVAITGKVTFYDGATVVGAKPLVSGVAQISTIALPAGVRKLKAFYAGDGIHAAATSNIVTQTVQAQPSVAFAAKPLSIDRFLLAVGDFNGDGKADLAVEVAGTNGSVAIMLGDGAGNFTTGPSVTGSFAPPIAVAADFNGDGKLDLAVVLAGGPGLAILLGNGDGTLQSPVTLPYSFTDVAVGDFNGDGIVDIAGADSPTGVNILLGNGDGTFRAPVVYPTSSLPNNSQAQVLVVGNFNGDGIADIAASNRFSPTLSILLGKGDGTFQAFSSITLPAHADSLATADFNGDGKADLVTSNGDVLLGNGDGTFQSPVTYFQNEGLNVGFVRAADFNGDGNTDILIPYFVLNTNRIDGLDAILYGRGDGTFQSPVFIPNPGSSPLVGEFNGDGKTDLALGGTLELLLGTTVSITATGGTQQNTYAGTAFPVLLQVVVKNGANPASGVSVTFTAPSSGASATFSSPTAVTDANGVASVMATANSLSGAYTVTAVVSGMANDPPATFALTNLAGPVATSVTVSGPASQQTPVGSAFPTPLQVLVIDASGHPANNVTVAFTAPASGASAILSSQTAFTGITGLASVTATANTIAGSYHVTAAVNGLTTTFSLTNTGGTPATVTLASSANPATFGAPLTLTATVANATSTGRVTFFDGVNIIGTKPTASGVASLSTSLLSAGSHKLTAYYRDDVSSTAGTSNVLTETVRAAAGTSLAPQSPISLPVIPKSAVVADFNGDGKPDFASVSQDTGSWWQVDLGASAAIGSVTIWNRTDCCASRLSNYWIFVSDTPFLATDTPSTLQNRPGTFSSGQQINPPNPSATIAVNAQGRYVRVQLSFPGYLSLAEVQVFGAGAQSATNLALGKAASQSSTLPGAPSAVAASAVDGNTDGSFYDGSVTSTSLNLLSILLGKGDGTFQTPVNYAASSTLFASGDFNGDGNTDLAFLNNFGGAGTVSILTGNGDGTFRPSVDYPVGSNVGRVDATYFSSMAVGDFNGDGRADILVGLSNFSSRNTSALAALYLLPGNGDGTFGAPVSYANAPFALPFAMADFNGDGKPDLAGYFGNLGVVPGNGDGTAQAPVLSNAPANISILSMLLTAGDFNGDGKMDLAIASLTSAPVTWIFPGNGDGTYQTGASYPGAAMATGDFNGDGILDLVIADASGNTSGVLFGNGDGTFLPGLTIAAGAPLAVADFNGDGRADILAASSSGAAILLGVTGGASNSVTATGGTPQSASVGAPFPTALQVTVKNAAGSPLSGVTVTFAVPTVGASATLSSATAVTNASGVASVTATANNVAGSYTVTASVGTLSASFSLTNVSGGGGSSNLAVGKNATQSSTLPGAPTAVAASAVDGNTDGSFFHGSVTATNLDSNPWWQVDLGASATVSSVVIWNRTDCCGSRLSDFWVFISDTPFLATDTPATLQNRAGTFASHQTSAPNPYTTIPTVINPCPPGAVCFAADILATGRYVRIQLSSANYLSLAEVQVFGTGAPAIANLAQGKAATQSSTLPGASTAAAASAVDGNLDGNFFDGSVTATNLDPNPWWQVDLGASAAVSSVVIFNRTDCCGARLSDYWVFVSDTPFLATDTPATLQNRAGTFASHQTSAPNPSTTILAGAQGRYVRVQLSGANYLSLAEVQVFGTGAPAISNLSQGKAATQSSTLPGASTAAAVSAVDGNTDGNFFDGSVTATNLDPNPWWQVDLGASASVSSIVIYNRTDCCGTRLSDYWVFVSDTPFLATDTPATLQNRAGTFASHQTTAPNPSTTILAGAQGRYVRVQLSSAGYLSLAEVQVFGQ